LHVVYIGKRRSKSCKNDLNYENIINDACITPKYVGNFPTYFGAADRAAGDGNIPCKPVRKQEKEAAAERGRQAVPYFVSTVTPISRSNEVGKTPPA